LEAAKILNYLRKGCTELGFNEAVYEFAHWVRASPLKSALVTANMDVFSDVIVPSHGLDRLFDVIVNSADVGTCDKTVLWPMAFQALEDGITYRNALLIEDGEVNPAKFRERGGIAYQYRGDLEFRAWLRNMNVARGEIDA
jgi:beta-phosphoglucomutase-like phosphatase (HAD superfamily)